MDWRELKDLDLAEIGSWPRSAQWLLWALLAGLLSLLAYHGLIQGQLQRLEQAAVVERGLKQDYETRFQTLARLAGTPAVDTPPRMGAAGSVATLLEQISRAGSSNGVEFLLFQPEPEQKGASFTELPIRIRVAGSYHQFGRFISDLAQRPEPIRLQGLRISQGGRDASRPLLMELVAMIYRLPASGSGG